MASQDDSLECDIWDYKPALKKQERSTSSATSSKTSLQKPKKKTNEERSATVKQLKLSVKRKGSIQSKISDSPKRDCRIDKHNAEGCKDDSDQVQIIDLDLEPDFEIPTAIVLKPGASKHVNINSNATEPKCSSMPLSDSHDSKKPVLSQAQSNLSNNIKKRSNNSKNTTKTKTSSPMSKSRRTSLSSKTKSSVNEEKCMPSIAAYFSPKKSNIRAVLTTEKNAIDISDDDFELNDLNKSIGDQEINDSSSNCVKDGEFEQKPAEETSNCSNQKSQGSQLLPSVNVDIIHDEESDQSSFETENRSALPPSEEDCNKESLDNKMCLEDQEDATRDSSDLKIRSNMSSNTQKIRDDLESGFLVSEDSPVTDDLLIEGEECLKDTLVSCPRLNTPDEALDIQTSKACSFDLAEESGGFLTEPDITEEDKTKLEGKEIDLKLHPQSTSNKVSLLSSTSWPTMSSSTTKQTTLFSFLKAKSQSGSNLPSTKPELGSSSTTGITAASTSSSGWRSNSSFWRNQNRPSDSSADNYQESGKKRSCPFYKKIPGTPITVDAFRYGVIPGCEAYVLTHFHYDHYGGLTKKFAQPIFCSQVTGNLVESRIGVHNKWINRLPMWKPCKVADTTLTLMEANHCPGAVIILFELKDGRKILHTGDFRANSEMETYSALQGIRISELYLDTTYCNPSYAFPHQAEVVHFVIDLVLRHVSDHPSTLIVCGAYTIGKERIFQAIAKALDSKICVMNDKKKVLDCLEDPDLKSRVTLDWSAGRVHVLPMGKLTQQHLKEHHARHLRFENILAFQPTGWTHSDKQASLSQLKPKWSRDGIILYGVPYSEHSSFLELKRFVQHFRPLKILPTVNNGSPTARGKMDEIFRQWMREKVV